MRQESEPAVFVHEALASELLMRARFRDVGDKLTDDAENRRHAFGADFRGAPAVEDEVSRQPLAMAKGHGHVRHLAV